MSVQADEFDVCAYSDLCILSLLFATLMLDVMRLRYQIGTVKGKVEIEVPSKTGETADQSGFNLQNFFDSLYETKETAEASTYSILFGAGDAKLILSKWEIVYDKSAELLAPRNKKDERGNGLDGYVINCSTYLLTYILIVFSAKGAHGQR